MKNIISCTALLLLATQSVAMDLEVKYPLVAAPLKPVEFNQKDIKNIPFLNQKIFGTEGINAVDEHGNFYLNKISRTQLIDIQSLARKGENLKVCSLRTKVRDLIKLAELAEAWGLSTLKPGLVNLYDYCLKMKIKTLSESQNLRGITIKKISDSRKEQIFVSKLTGRTVTINNVFTVDDIKLEIFEKEGIPTAQQRLVFDGKLLEEGQFLSSYDVKDYSTLHLILSLAGS